MTRGTVLVLGKLSHNAGAGMTGGKLYLDRHYDPCVNRNYLRAEPLDPQDAAELRALLEETMDEIGHFHYARIDLQIENSAKARLMQELSAGGITSIAGFAVAQHNFSDGFKYIFADGSWLLIRPSGTEPVLRLYSEAGDQAKVAQLLEAARGIAGV